MYKSKILGIASDRSLHPIGYWNQNAPIDESSIAGVTKDPELSVPKLFRRHTRNSLDSLLNC